MGTWAAMARYRDGYDFADALISETNILAGADKSYSFNRRAAELSALIAVNWDRDESRNIKPAARLA